MSVPNMRLRMHSHPENVTVIRAALRGLAESLDIVRPPLDDILTAASEAANNVVLHAYPASRDCRLDGPLELDATITAAGRLLVVVGDRGVGFAQRAWGDDSTGHIGLSVIRALADRVELQARRGGGTEVRMEFCCQPALRIDAPGGGSGQLAGKGSAGKESAGEGSAGDVTTEATRDGAPGDATVLVSIAPPRLLAGVLGRLTATLAARAQLSLDRLSDAQLVSDLLVAQAPLGGDSIDPLTFAFRTDTRRLELTVGPLPRGRSDRLARAGQALGAEPILATLADRLSSEPLEDAELLHVTLLDRRHQPHARGSAQPS